MNNYSKVLTQAEVDLINQKFGTDLVYTDACHYRAAQVIWNLWKGAGHE